MSGEPDTSSSAGPLMNPVAQQMCGRKTAGRHTRVRVGVGVVIRDQRGSVLMEKRRDSGLWGLPGGRIEPGESVRVAAVREVKEQIGLTIKIPRLIGVYSEPVGRIVTFPHSGDMVHLVDLILEVTPISGALICGAESEEVPSFDPSVLPGDVVPPARLSIADALNSHVGIVH